MATRTSLTLQPSNSTDALFRAWAQFIHDSFVTTAGWVNTADTGQIDLTTVLTPAAVNTKQGYKIYRMADALQATKPVFIRIDFGSAATSALNPGIWLTIGTGSDGAGNITGLLFNGGASASPTVTTNTNSATASNSYSSGNTNRIALLLFAQATSRVICLCIERSKDASGVDTGDGLMVIWNGNAANINNSQYLLTTPGTQPNGQAGVHYILCADNPSAFAGDVGIGIPILMKGTAQQPGYNMIITRTNDFSAEGSFVLSLYGNNITYQLANTLNASLPPAGNQTTVRVGIRFD